MKLAAKRKEALTWAIKNNADSVVDRLLNCHVEMLELNGDFHITVNGISICMLDRALTGGELNGFDCDCTCLQQAIRNRNVVKAAFPGAIVTLKSGKCPMSCSVQAA